MNKSFMYESDDTYTVFACSHHFTLCGIPKFEFDKLLNLIINKLVAEKKKQSKSFEP